MLRWLGVVLPLIVTYPVVCPVFGGTFTQSSVGVMVPVGAALWIAFAAALMWRRDWKSAAAVSAFYLIVVAWWWILPLGIIELR